MTSTTSTISFQMPQAWHDGGMFMGMHWLWWTFWIVVMAVLVWGFLRLFADRRETHRRACCEEEAEGELRGRFARGEIDEDEYARRLEVLRETYLGV